MADLCVFCGKRLPLFGRREILCSGILQPLCSDCFPTISELSHEERGWRALNSGRAVDPAGLRKAMEERKELLKESEAKVGEWNQKKAELESFYESLTCLRCGQPMARLGRKWFQTGYYQGRSPAVGIEFELVQCGNCGKVEFFAPDPIPFQEEETPTVTCPVCGWSHHPGVGCPRCAMSQVEGGRVRKADWDAAQKKGSGSSGPKPPWEQ